MTGAGLWREFSVWNGRKEGGRSEGWEGKEGEGKRMREGGREEGE